MKMLRNVVWGAIAAVLIATVAYAAAPKISAGVIQWFNGGTLSFLQRVNSSGQLVFTSNVNGLSPLTLDDNNASVNLLSRTSTQIQASTPTAGALYYSSTNQTLCVGNGTDFIMVSSRTAQPGNQVKCY